MHYKDLEIVYKDIEELKPFKRNPKEHPEKQIKNISKSIEKYGWRSPLLVNFNTGDIIAGHGRVLAARRLGIDRIPCIDGSDMTEEQINEYRYLDNKLNESDWDMGILSEDWPTLDFSDFDLTWGVEEEEDGDEEYYGAERERTANAYNLHEYDETETEGKYEMPIIKPCFITPGDLIGFNYALSSKRKDCGIHFYIDDYQFERVWNQPGAYIDKLKEYECVLTPDFSLYTDMPIAMQIWNIYRSRLIGQLFQRAGMQVIPTVSWCREASFDFSFDGLPKNSILSVSTVGVKRDKDAFRLWADGMDEMIRRLHPKTLLVYGGEVDYDYGSIKTVYYKNHVTEEWKNED